MCSIHANSARDALVKLSTLPLLAGRNIDSAFVVPTVASAIDLVVHCELVKGGSRRVAEIVAPTGAVAEGVIEADTLFRMLDGGLAPTGVVPARVERFTGAGLDPAMLLAAEARAAAPGPALAPKGPGV